MKVWLEDNNQPIFGEGRCRLMEAICRYGSINGVLHELGHYYYKHDPSAVGIASQIEESEADQFAIDVMARMKVIPYGVAVFDSIIATLLISGALTCWGTALMTFKAYSELDVINIKN